jgi:NADH-quinone oxidoreductase subunit A
LLASYLPILFMLGIAGAFAGVTVFGARAISPKDPSPAKQMPYESGIEEIDPMAERFPVRFYLVAMLFVIFDVEVILFFPWAVSFQAFPAFSLIAMTVFLGLLAVAFVYEWRNGGLEWD